MTRHKSLSKAVQAQLAHPLTNHHQPACSVSSLPGLPERFVLRAGTLVATGLALVLLAGCATGGSGGDETFTQKMTALSERISRSVDPAVKSFTETATPYAASLAASIGSAGERMQRYIANREIMKNNKDTGLHNENSLLALLKSVGISDGSADRADPGSPPARPSASPGDAAGDWRWPVDAGIITSSFGARWGKQHRGMDIAADIGEPVLAMADGTVVYSDNKMRGYGNVIVIKHDDNMTSLYAHNDKLISNVGDKVSKGTVVSLLGNTGKSTGPHVHFEIRKGKTALDPYSLLPATSLAVAHSDHEAIGDLPLQLAGRAAPILFPELLRLRHDAERVGPLATDPVLDALLDRVLDQPVTSTSVQMTGA